ncbi:MAG: DsrE family protein [Proteobacteria bacterium]|nr:DsrE family protein [Pseudomonadota bacterium]MBU1715647.1 DsrE family protein [Pseudomonadota bacterium]
MKKKIMLVVKHSTDDLERSNAAMALALSLLSEEVDLAIFFIFQGALLAKKGVAESIHGHNFAPVRDLWPEILQAKIPMYVCGACAKTYNISGDDLVVGVKIVQLPTLASEMISRETITF